MMAGLVMDEGRKRVLLIAVAIPPLGSSVNWRARDHPRPCIQSSRTL
jgi:hypothetical protein